MERYCAFLRGINISGKNKIPMAALKLQLQGLGYRDVATFLNSGNVVFTADCGSAAAIGRGIEDGIRQGFGLDIPVYVIPLEELKNILEHAPGWWGTGSPEKYDNLIFILSEDTPQSVADRLGPVSQGLEQAELYGNVLFWTFDRTAYQKCNWWKRTADGDIAPMLTIRTANTLRRVCK